MQFFHGVFFRLIAGAIDRNITICAYVPVKRFKTMSLQSSHFTKKKKKSINQPLIATEGISSVLDYKQCVLNDITRVPKNPLREVTKKTGFTLML